MMVYLVRDLVIIIKSNINTKNKHTKLYYNIYTAYITRTFEISLILYNHREFIFRLNLNWGNYYACFGLLLILLHHKTILIFVYKCVPTDIKMCRLVTLNLCGHIMFTIIIQTIEINNHNTLYCNIIINTKVFRNFRNSILL